MSRRLYRMTDPVRASIRGGTVTVDAQDLDLVHRYTWRVITTPAGKRYAAAHGNGATVYLHRLIDETPPSMETDHANGDGLDNRRTNLRTATSGQNKVNRQSRPHTSRYKGVSWDQRRDRWVAYLSSGGQKRNLGRYTDEGAAARAYDRAARRQHGRFAVLNFPEGSPA